MAMSWTSYAVNVPSVPAFLVSLNTLIDDRYTYHENTREIIGQHSRKIYRIRRPLVSPSRPHRPGREKDQLRRV